MYRCICCNQLTNSPYGNPVKCRACAVYLGLLPTPKPELTLEQRNRQAQVVLHPRGD